MAHKGLNKEMIVKSAVELIEQKGRKKFSMRLLAENLSIKTSSLYNHIKDMNQLIEEVCNYTLQLQKNIEVQAIEGKNGEEAVRILADAYRSFAKEHRELYWLTMEQARCDNFVLEDAAVSLTEPLKQMLMNYNLREGEYIHFRRMFRAIVHGFISQEEEGFFSHYPVSVEESFHFSIQCFIDSLNQGVIRKTKNE